MGSKIIEIFNKIAYNVLSALYQPFWAAVLLAFLNGVGGIIYYLGYSRKTKEIK